LPLLIRRIFSRKSSTKQETFLFILQLLLVVFPTSVAVITFINIFPSGEYESARGLLAGILLRLGLALSLVLSWTKWPPRIQAEQ
jgi:cytochrome c biogenesis protein CcdA